VRGLDAEKNPPGKGGGNMYTKRCEYEQRLGISPLIVFPAQELRDELYQTRYFFGGA